ncbi:MAG: type IV pilus assembly protein PilM [Solirubrobacterales bacterium]
MVGLEIEAAGIAAAEVVGANRVNGALHPLPPDAFQEGEIADPDAIVASLKELWTQHKLSKRVRVGIGNQRVVVRTLRLPAIEDPGEMEAAVRFQAQEQMPMPLDQAILEHQVVGGVPGEDGASPQVDVVVVAARRDMVQSFVEPLRRAGLEPVGIDLSAFGMIRALAGVDEGGMASPAEPGAPASPDQAVLYCNLGDVMNLAVARGRSCLFTRVSPGGMEPIVARLSNEGGLTPEHARQWLMYVGLNQPAEEIGGDPEMVARTRSVLSDGVSDLVDELRLSLDYYGAQESAIPVDRIVVCGPGSAIPGLASAMEGSVGLPIVSARPPAFAGYDDGVAARLTLAYGLALEN